MAMDLHDLLRLRCSDMLVMAREIWQMNNLMAREVQHMRLREALERHYEPMRQAISNLEQIVDGLGGIMGNGESPIMQGILREHRLFLEMSPSPEIIDVHDLLEADIIAHLQLSTYTGLISLARQLGETDIAMLLEQNRQGEDRQCALLEREAPTVLAQGEQRRAA